MDRYAHVKSTDPEIYAALRKEAERQQSCLELIASENHVSEAVLEAQGSVLTNKYAEGYPSRRYYGGCEAVDIVESLAIARAKELFGAEHANVQPHSGAQANTAVFFAVLQPGDRILGMALDQGGHLTHGMHLNLSGKWFEAGFYYLDRESEELDYDALRRRAEEFRPKMLIAGASAYSRFIDYAQMREIADSVGAYLMVDMAHVAGLVAAGLHPNPVPYADFVTSTTHKTLRGPRGGLILCKEQYAKQIDSAVFPGIQGGPLMHVIAAKAVAFKEALSDDFKLYMKQVQKNASCLAEALRDAGLRVVTGGTDNHMLLVDLRETGISGKELQKRMDSLHLTANKNSIPYDEAKPFVTSGLRLGTAAVTSRGLREEEMKQIAGFVASAVFRYDEDREAVLKGVAELCERFPLKTSSEER